MTFNRFTIFVTMRCHFSLNHSILNIHENNHHENVTINTKSFLRDTQYLVKSSLKPSFLLINFPYLQLIKIYVECKNIITKGITSTTESLSSKHRVNKELLTN